jgi:hypothetical protein
MWVLIFLLGLFLFLESECIAQVYKYVDEKGAICFSDNPPPSKEGVANEEKKPNEEKKAKEIVNNRKGRTEIKDIMQLAQEVLEEELAKPPEKQNRRLIQEMGEVLYGDVSGTKPKQAPASSQR